jgi:fructose-1,6-bisphosphatase/inositol monophosphatase family enzyme
MLAKLAEGKVSAVFEPLGQHPHDSVPGLFIAQKAGAYLARPDGSPLELGRAIKKREDITYIASCNEALFNDLAGLLRKPTRAR